MRSNLSEFASLAIAEQSLDGNGWTVYCDGEKRCGIINNCQGNTEFEAIEDAWQFYQALKNETQL